MNQRGAGNAVSIVSVLGLVIAVLALPSFTGLVGATGHDACDRAEAIEIDAVLYNPNARPTRPDVTIDLSQPIVAGSYSVTLVSFDEHSDQSGQSDQTEEQWFAQLLDGDGRVVYESAPTRDLPDEQSFLSDTFSQQTVTGTATQLRAVHQGAGKSINSIIALCAVFTPEPEPPIDPEPEPGRIIVKKVTEPAGSIRDFKFSPSYGPDFTLRHGQENDSGPLVPGIHAVAEDLPGSWKLASATCDDGSAPGAIDLQEDKIVTCTFTNTPEPKVVDLELTKTVDQGLVTIGEVVTFTIAVTNLGPDDATGVEVTDTLPAGLSHRSHHGDGSFNPASGVWAIGELASGDDVVLDLVVNADQVGVLTNVAEVSDGDQLDTDRDDAVVTVRRKRPIPPTPGAIGDSVWFDANRNGVDDPGETGVSGVTVTLTNNSGELKTDVTDSSGNYVFSGLAAGSYTVRIDGTTIPDNTVLTTPGSFTVRLREGRRFLTADFGLYAARPIVRLDVDADRDGVFRDHESVPEGESTARFRVTIETELEVTLEGLVGDTFGDLAGRGTCLADGSERISAGATYVCAFTETVIGDGDETQTYEVTASFSGDASVADTATVRFIDLVPRLEVTKTLVSEGIGPGEIVEFIATITNVSRASTDPVTLDRLVDLPYGDVTNPSGSIVASACALVTIPPGDTYTCTFSIELTGSAGDSEVDILTAEGHDDERNPVYSDDVLILHPIVSFADLEVVFTDNLSTTARLRQDETFSYFLYVVNRDRPQDQFTVTITLPHEVTPESPLPSGCTLGEPSRGLTTIECRGLPIETGSEFEKLLELPVTVGVNLDETVIARAEVTVEGSSWSEVAKEPTVLTHARSGTGSPALWIALLILLVLGLAGAVGVQARRRGSARNDGTEHGL